MAYVDLNPIRAAMVRIPEQSVVTRMSSCAKISPNNRFFQDLSFLLFCWQKYKQFRAISKLESRNL